MAGTRCGVPALGAAAELERVRDRVAEAGQDPEQRDGGVLVRDPSQNALLLTTAR